MDIKVHNQSEKATTIAVSDRLFGAPLKADLIWQVATSQMSNNRRVLAHAKTRSEVSGGGRKPWRQKGTGRARHGSIRSPIWIGGGVAHGPTKDVNFKKKVSTAQGRAALASVVSDRVKGGQLLVVDSLTVSSGKTKDAAVTLAELTKNLAGYRMGGRILVVLAGTADDAMTRRAFANIPSAQVMRAQDLNALIVLSFPYVIATVAAVETMNRIWGKEKKVKATA